MRIFERALLVAGIILFAILIQQLGPQSVWDNLRLVGWGVLPIIAQEALAYWLNTAGWFFAFAPPRPAVAFGQMLRARLAGDAVNYVTPTATIGGEFVRLRMLRGSVDDTELLSSLMVSKLTQTIGQIVFIIAGLLLLVRELPLQDNMRHALVLVLIVFSAVAGGLLLLQRRGMFAPLLRLLGRIGMPHTPELLQRVEKLDAAIAHFHGHASGPFFLSVSAFALGWAMGVVEIYLILYFLGVPVSIERALMIEVLSATLDGLMFFVPAKAGTQEGGKVLIFTLLGLDPAKGLAVGILRRIRELTWAGAGLLIWSRHQMQTSQRRS